MKIAFIGGSWSSNIGNAFYNLGALAFLENIPQVEAFFVPDPPHWKEGVANDFDLISNLDVDLVVLAGPCLNLRLPKIFAPIFASLQKRNVKFGFISAGMSLYDEGEAKVLKDFFSTYPPQFIFTRDSDTYNILNKVIDVCKCYDGLCTSMFLNDAVKVPGLAIPEYYVYNFDDEYEPAIIATGDNDFHVGDRHKKKINELNGKPVIRTNNNDIGVGYKKIYGERNVYHSDLPYGYLSILKQAEVVFSERVHTCAATLILGGTAQFIPMAKRSFEKRSKLFDRIRLSEIVSKPVKLNFDYLNGEKERMRVEFANVLSAL